MNAKPAGCRCRGGGSYTIYICNLLPRRVIAFILGRPRRVAKVGIGEVQLRQVGIYPCQLFFRSHKYTTNLINSPFPVVLNPAPPPPPVPPHQAHQSTHALKGRVRPRTTQGSHPALAARQSLASLATRFPPPGRDEPLCHLMVPG